MVQAMEMFYARMKATILRFMNTFSNENNNDPSIVVHDGGEGTCNPAVLCVCRREHNSAALSPLFKFPSCTLWAVMLW
jgi:hypothetical protein